MLKTKFQRLHTKHKNFERDKSNEAGRFVERIYMWEDPLKMRFTFDLSITHPYHFNARI